MEKLLIICKPLNSAAVRAIVSEIVSLKIKLLLN